MDKLKINLYKIFFIVILLFSYNINAQEVICFKEKVTNAPSFKWTHTIPSGILDSAKRVALYIEAYDIDYPKRDEGYRVYVNGHDIGSLEGVNEGGIIVEKIIPKSILKQGINNFQVDINTQNNPSNDWNITIRSSELRFYCDDSQKDFVISLNPDKGEIKKGEAFESQITIIALNNFDSPVNLKAENLPQGIDISFENNNITPNPTSSLKFHLKCLGNVVAGVYPIKIIGSAGDKIHSKDFILKILAENRSVKIKADKDFGYAPLKVSLSPLLTNFTENSLKYTWDFGNGESSKEKFPSYTFKTSGNHNVKLTVSDSKGNNFYAEKVIMVKNPNYKFTKNFEVKSAYKGKEVSFFINLVNNSPYDIKDLVIKDKLSENLTYLEDDCFYKSNIQGKTLVWKFPFLKSKDRLKIKVKVRVSKDCKDSIIYNTARLHHKDLQYEIESNTAKLKIEELNLKLIKSVDKKSVVPGGELNYSLILKNLGKIKAEKLKLEDKLPAGLNFVKVSKELSFNNGSLVWQGDLKAGQTKEFNIKCKVDETLFLSTIISNMATLSSSYGLNLKSNKVETIVKLNSSQEGKIKLNFRHRVQIPQTEVGRVSVFKVEIENSSNYTILNPMVRIILPQGFSYVPNSTLKDNVLYKNPNGKREISWNLPYIRGKSSVYMTYRLISGADSKRGKNISRATLTGLSNSNEKIKLYDECLIALSGDTFSFNCDLEGIVFLDENDNGNYDIGDIPVGGVEVILSNGNRARSDEQGKYKFSDLYPGSYALGINKNSLNKKFKPADFTKIVTLSEGISEQEDIAIQFANKDYDRYCVLEGRVFFDKDRNAKFSYMDILADNFVVSIDDKFKTLGRNGRFIFTNLKKGIHKLKISYGKRVVYKSVVTNNQNTSIDIPLKYFGVRVYVSGENK